jgi:hypothetical protein
VAKAVRRCFLGSSFNARLLSWDNFIRKPMRVTTLCDH